MKNIIALLLFSFSLTCFAQQKGKVRINWIEKTEISFGSYKMNVPQFSSDSFYFDSYKKTISYLLNLPQSGSVDENSLQITNLVYETIAIEKLGDLDRKAIPTSAKATLKSTLARDKNFAFISLSPIIKEGDSFKKIISFSYFFANISAKDSYQSKTATNITNSVLATGDWYRFYVEKSGVYKISKGFLEQLGFNTNVDPRNIKIYGNGGRMLPLLNSTSYPSDLAENAIQLIGENDGVFNNEDYILFYAEGVDNWNDESQTHVNLYADKTYYYVTSQGNEGKRIASLQQPTDASSLAITTFDDYQFHEIDKFNIAKTGRRWFGENFNIDNSQEFNFSVPNVVPTIPIQIQVSAGAASFAPTFFAVEANNLTIGTLTFSALSSGSGTELVVNSLPQNTTIPASNAVTVKLTYNNSGVPTSDGYLDYIIVKSKRNLQGYGKQFRFQYTNASSTSGVGDYQLSNASTINAVWDITDIYNVTKIENNGQNAFSFKANMGAQRKYIAVDGSDFYAPIKDSQSKVTNQNLLGTIFKNNSNQFQDVDYLIITPEFLKTQAEKLKNQWLDLLLE